MEVARYAQTPWMWGLVVLRRWLMVTGALCLWVILLLKQLKLVGELRIVVQFPLCFGVSLVQLSSLAPLPISRLCALSMRANSTGTFFLWISEFSSTGEIIPRSHLVFGK